LNELLAQNGRTNRHPKIAIRIACPLFNQIRLLNSPGSFASQIWLPRAGTYNMISSGLALLPMSELHNRSRDELKYRTTFPGADQVASQARTGPKNLQQVRGACGMAKSLLN
tara:strand:- start:183 stop:518 length:336 start_codon:yes stop_codon:yes gene_type:complete